MVIEQKTYQFLFCGLSNNYLGYHW